MIRAEASGAGLESWVAAKIQPRHHERVAMVYVRQSTPQQVLENRESTALQYGLRSRAIEWGWSPDRVVIVDQDLGRSGSSSEGRSGFQLLLAEVGLDHVGVILGVEMSRLARSCRDWYQLLELCAVFGVLLADQEGLYDPQQYNDRLLLGLKGTISEAELHLLHQRTRQGMLNKARRGALCPHPPLGYTCSAGGELQLDPDEQVQSIVRLIFEKFDQIGSINGVLSYLVRHGVRLPIRSQFKVNRGELEWHRPNRVTLAHLLHHPLYAGAYTWGRRPTDPKRKLAGRLGTGRSSTATDPEAAKVLIKGRCPAYITWEQFQANLRQMEQNRSRWDRRGPVRGGGALLAGLVICGKCGCRLLVSYKDQRHTRYTCMRRRITYGDGTCQSFSGKVLEELAERQVLRVLESASLDLSVAAARDIQHERQLIERQWKQRLERAHYELDRAARQYHAVEPENRLVARELERRWEQALRQEQDLKEQYERDRQQQPAELSESDRLRIAGLANDIPALWHSAACTTTDRQQVVRHLIERVVVSGGEPKCPVLEVEIHFAGGYVSRHELRRPVLRWEQLPEYPKLMQRLGELAAEKQTAGQIAERLNAEGWHPPKRRGTFNAPMVQGLLARRGLKGKRPSSMQSELLGDHEWWLSDLARQVDVSQPTLHNWLRRGWVHARQLLGPQGRWILWADPDELKRLKSLRSCERGWYNQPLAAELTTPKARVLLS